MMYSMPVPSTSQIGLMPDRQTLAAVSSEISLRWKESVCRVGLSSQRGGKRRKASPGV